MPRHCRRGGHPALHIPLRILLRGRRDAELRPEAARPEAAQGGRAGGEAARPGRRHLVGGVQGGEAAREGAAAQGEDGAAPERARGDRSGARTPGQGWLVLAVRMGSEREREGVIHTF